MSYELVCVSLFSQVYHCGGIKTAWTKTTKNTLDTRGNHQQYTGIKKKVTFQHLILYCFLCEKKSTDYKIRAQHCACTPLSPGQLVAFATAHLWYFLPLLS